jgi:mRNA interferase ChpB
MAECKAGWPRVALVPAPKRVTKQNTQIERGDIYLVSLDPKQGHEQQGSRPVIVISPEPFNRITKLPIVLPITSGGSLARSIGFAVVLTGTQTTGVVRCDQPRALDLTVRLARRLERAPDSVVDEVLMRVQTIFQ